MGLTRAAWMRAHNRLRDTVKKALNVAFHLKHTKVYNKLRRINQCRPRGKHMRRCRVTSYCIPCMNVYMKRLAQDMANFLRGSGDEKHYVYKRREIIWIDRRKIDYEDMKNRLIPLLIHHKDRMIHSFRRYNSEIIGISSKLEIMTEIHKKCRIGLCMSTMLVSSKSQVWSMSKYWERYLKFDTPGVIEHEAKLSYLGPYRNEAEAKRKLKECFPTRMHTTYLFGPEVLEGFLYASFDRDLWKSCGQIFNASNDGRSYDSTRKYRQTEREQKKRKYRVKMRKTRLD